MGLFAPTARSASRRGGSARRRPPSIRELQAQAQQLELANRELGAPEIDQEKPGVFRTIIDLLSRPNFAIAGFAEELFDGTPSVTQGVTRALTEIFSGIGGIKGEKRAFGEVLENLGVGTKTLADAFPALEGTWVGAFGSRGAAGLALDIATDPLTYMTFGASAGAKASVGIVGKGRRFLNAKGAEKLSALRKQFIDEDAIKAAIDAEDFIAPGVIKSRGLREAEEEFVRLHTVGDDIAKDLLNEGGAKLKIPFVEARVKIPGSDQIGRPMREVLKVIPAGIRNPIIEGATAMKESMFKATREIFSPEGPLSHLPQPIRDRAVAITNNFFRGSLAHRSHLMSQWEDIDKVYRKLEKADPGIGKRWHDIREGAGGAFKSAQEEALFARTMSLYDKMGETAVQYGLIDPETYAALTQGATKYIHRVWENPEAFAMYKARPGFVPSGEGTARHLKQRKFSTGQEAIQWSEEAHAASVASLGKKEADKVVPILKQNYDVMGNMEVYIRSHSDALARQAWREEMVAAFGKEFQDIIKVADSDALWEATEAGLKAPTAAELNAMSKGIPEGMTPETFAKVRAIQVGQIEPQLVEQFGEKGAQYQLFNSKITGNEDILLPKIIGDTLEGVQRNMFESKEVQGMLKGFDWMNNQFKWGTYTLWPASLTRDAYSNLFLAGLRIGVRAISPSGHKSAIKLMGRRGGDEIFANSGYTYKQLESLSKSFGVWVPGSVFVESVGKFKLGKFRKVLTDKRSLVENEARVMLWLDEIAHGIDPREAADTVGKFLFNYGEVSPIERKLFRRLIPFYTFTRKNVELQAKLLRENPGLVLNQVKPFRKRDSEGEMMVKWEREGLGIRLDKDGRTVHMIQGVDLPIRNIDTLWAGGVGPTGRRIMGMVTPLIKTPLEALSGRDFFTGGDLKRVHGPTLGRVLDSKATPKALKDWMGFKKEIDPAGHTNYTFDGVRYALVVKSWMFSRAMSTSDRGFREYSDDPTAGRAMLDFLTGLRVKELDLDEQQRRTLQRRIRQLQQSAIRRGRLEQFTRPFERKNQQATF